MIEAGQIKKQTKPKAPYATTHCRVPVPIKMQVMAMVRDWREKSLAEFRQKRNSRP